jgi:drug/metabolite transporter (DMT)-like permease
MEIMDQTWFAGALLLGILFMLSFFLFALSTQKAGMAITALSSKMSVVIPVLLGAYLYVDEQITFLKIAGLLLAILSFYFIFKKEKSIKLEMHHLRLPILIFLFSGANDSILKYIREVHFEQAKLDLNAEILFIGSLFTISFISSLLLFGIKSLINKETLHFNSIIGGLVLGVINLFSSMSMFKAMGFFDSAVFFPIFNIGIVIMSAIIGILFFHEKLTKTNLMGMLIALIAILILTSS